MLDTGRYRRLLQVLREQLGPGELDAAARVCRTWASQLAHDVVHCEMCLPGCYELLLCQLEQLAKRFKNVHDWHLWLPAGAQWGLINDLLWLLSRWVLDFPKGTLYSQLCHRGVH